MVSQAVSQLTGLSELSEIAFSDIRGTVNLLQGGIFEVALSINSALLQARSKGTVHLDGELLFPVQLLLMPTLTQKLDAKGTLSNYLTNERGEVELLLVPIPELTLML